MSIRVQITDDHGILRDSLRDALAREDDLQIVAVCEDGEAAVETALDLGPDVVVMDVTLPRRNGIDAAAEILRERPDIGIVMLTMHHDAATVDRALRAGARAYVLKGASVPMLVDAIRAVERGDVWLSPEVSRFVVDGYIGGADVVDPLTPRERQILQYLAEGHTSREVADALGLKVKTVQNARSAILDKTGERTSAGLVRYAMRIGLVD